MTNGLHLTPSEAARALIAQRRRIVESERKKICPIIRRAIDDEREAVKLYRELEENMAPIINEIEAEHPGVGTTIIRDIENIIKEQQNHEIIFNDISFKIKCPLITIPRRR